MQQPVSLQFLINSLFLRSLFLYFKEKQIVTFFLAKQFLIVPALKGEVDSKNDGFLKTEGFFLPCFVTAIREAKNPLRTIFYRK